MEQQRMWIPIDNVENNEFQTRGIVETNVAALMESIGKTTVGLWPNMFAAVYDAKDIPEIPKGATKEEQLKLTKNFRPFLPDGQQRMEAAIRSGITEMLLPVQVLTKKEAMVICYNANFEALGGSLVTTVGSVSGVYNRTVTQLDDSKTWATYQKKQFDMLTTKTQFDNAKKQGVGIKIIQSILGESWRVNTIRGALVAVKAIANGLYTEDDVESFSSIDGLNRFTTLANGIKDLNYPRVFLDETIAACIAVIQKFGASGKTIDLATGGLNEGFDPVRYLKDQMPISLSKKFMKKVRALLVDKIDLKSVYPDIKDEVVVEAQKQINKAVEDERKRAENEAAKGDTEDDGTDDTGGEDDGDAGDVGGEQSTDELFGGTDPGDQGDAKIVSFNMSAPVFISELQMAIEVVDEEVKDKETLSNIGGVFKAGVMLYAKRFGYKALRAMITQIQKDENGG